MVQEQPPFGWGAVDPANVGVSNGQLGIRLPGGSLNGGEVRSLSLTRFGSYPARIRVANAPSSLTAFFLYQKPDFAQELDIEIFNDSMVRFLVDGVELQRFTSGVTRSSMYLYVNAWFPSWLAGTRPTNDTYTYVDWIEHVER